MSTSVCSADFLSSSVMRKEQNQRKKKEENVSPEDKSSTSGAQSPDSVWSGLKQGFITVLRAQEADSHIEQFKIQDEQNLDLIQCTLSIHFPLGIKLMTLALQEPCPPS